MPAETTNWHQLPAEECAATLQADLARGLTPDEAARRLDREGANEIPEGKRRGPLAMLAAQFTDFMILVLLAAAVVSGLVGDMIDTIAIVVIVVLNALVGFVQEFRAERAMAALKQMAAPAARVIRDGLHLSLPARELVPGDLVELEAGNVVPADLRLVQVEQFRVDESALTGESQAVEKNTAVLHEPHTVLAERNNLAYKGTLAVNGRALGLVVATGAATELGRIAALLEAEKGVKTPLQKRLARFGQHLSVVVFALCVILFAVGVLRGEPVLLMFMTAVSLAVAAIPEALPAVVTIALALGARLMVKCKALVRHLPAVETLGSVTYICSDKTGTLTENRMRAERFFAAGVEQDRPPSTALVQALALNSDVKHSTAKDEFLGDPTEVALYRAAQQAALEPAEHQRACPRIAEIPFDAERKRMLTLHRHPEGGALAILKGAPEAVLPLCVAADGMPFQRAALLAQAEAMAGEGLRVLAFAQRRLDTAPVQPEDAERDLTFLGLVGLMDPPRAETFAAVVEAQQAGITPVMITGDHPATARAIAHRLGLVDRDGAVLTGAQLAQLPLAEFERMVEEVRVYARVSPEQKIKIVRALQDRGEFVAMTGDGVNDAPALKRADIGVAMGRGGTDVAREAADLVLLDDNFATIVRAVREGRRIYDNIRKFVKYTMTSNSGEVWTLFLAPFLGLPIPLLPIHILWINLVTDGLPGLALTAEPQERGIMRRPPRPPQENLFAQGLGYHVIWVGLLMGGITILTQALSYHAGNPNWQSMVFTVLTLSQMGHVLAIRSERDSLFAQGLWSNKPLVGAVALTFALQMAVLYVPWLNPIFKTAPLSAAELGFCLVLSSVVFFAVEIEKAVVRRRRAV
jgi:P-type Ca2+ transporter type 2C